jgi:hypothetical protein
LAGRPRHVGSVVPDAEVQHEILDSLRCMTFQTLTSSATGRPGMYISLIAGGLKSENNPLVPIYTHEWLNVIYLAFKSRTGRS